ncbi:MAG TPA: hypothetical protein VF202_01140 [Trueperaceae bacterium]
MNQLDKYGVQLVVELAKVGGRLAYVVTARRFRAVLPYCGCDKEACAQPGVWGRQCPSAKAKGAEGYTHRRDYCHGTRSMWHAEHAEVYAKAVLEMFGPKGRKHQPSARGRTVYSPKDFVPVDGEQITWYRAVEPERLEVLCTSMRCRQRPGHPGVVAHAVTSAGALALVHEHEEWHRQFGTHPRAQLSGWITKYAVCSPPEVAQ